MAQHLLPDGWKVELLVDDDGHLNVYIENVFSDLIEEIETGQGNGIGEQKALRFTTTDIEELSELP